ncbi:fructose-bisphosphate aldolase [Spirochaetia bacterium]|nr:fructose-bisphosphate aldolase [Spirochaetia bacterium]
MLVSMKEILDRANRENYAVMAPNVSMELDARAVLEAAEEMKSPLILDVLYKANPDMYLFGSYLRRLAEQASVPVAINQDHGQEYAHAVAAIRAGFTSIMVDRSALPYEENAAQVAELAKIAHAVNVSVEAELGYVGMGSNYDHDGISGLTEPSLALDYISRTGIDCLAVAIGTAHGAYKGKPKLDFDRLEEIKKITRFPLVLHGGSGTGEENLAKACKLGINKINVANDLFRAAHSELLKSDMEGNGVYKFWDVCSRGLKNRTKELIECFGGKGKAWVPETRGLPRIGAAGGENKMAAI